MKEYEENEALAFINENVPEELRNKYDDDDLLLIIDTIFDYYDSKGFLDISADDDDDDELDINDLTLYVKNQLRKDKDNIIELDDVKPIVLAEIQYEEKLEEDD